MKSSWWLDEPRGICWLAAQSDFVTGPDGDISISLLFSSALPRHPPKKEIWIVLFPRAPATALRRNDTMTLPAVTCEWPFRALCRPILHETPGRSAYLLLRHLEVIQRVSLISHWLRLRDANGESVNTFKHHVVSLVITVDFRAEINIKNDTVDIVNKSAN